MSPPPSDRPWRPSPLLTNALVALLCLLWGSTWLVIAGGLRDLPAFTSAGVRFAVAGLIMVGVALVVARREGGERPPTWLWVTLGSVNFAFSYGVVYRTETVLPSGLVSVLWGVFPMLMAVCGHLFLPGEQLRGRQWLGFVLGFGGLAVLFATDLQNFGPEGVPAALWLFTSPVVSAVGTTLVKRYGTGVNSALLNRNAMLLGAVLLLIAARVSEAGDPVAWTPRAIGSIAYLAVCGTVLTFGLYFWLLRYADAYKLSLIAYVTPAVALLLGWAVGKEPVTVYTLAGTGLILLGVVFVVRTGPAPARGAEGDPVEELSASS